MNDGSNSENKNSRFDNEKDEEIKGQIIKYKSRGPGMLRSLNGL